MQLGMNLATSAHPVWDDVPSCLGGVCMIYMRGGKKCNQVGPSLVHSEANGIKKRATATMLNQGDSFIGKHTWTRAKFLLGPESDWASQRDHQVVEMCSNPTVAAVSNKETGHGKCLWITEC